MAKTKEFFGLTITSMTQWWGPTTIRISGEPDVAKDIKKMTDGRVECNFPGRLVMIANHQVSAGWGQSSGSSCMGARHRHKHRQRQV